MSLWIAPAASQAVELRRRCQDCAGFASPAVKKAISSSSSKAPRTTISSPDSSSSSSARIAAASSSLSSESSASSCEEIATAPAPSLAACALTTSGTARSPSSTLAMKSTGLPVSGWSKRIASGASSGTGTVRAGRPALSASITAASHASSAIAWASPLRASRDTRWWRRSACSRSAKISSVSMISMSRCGSTLPSEWITFESP